MVDISKKDIYGDEDGNLWVDAKRLGQVVTELLTVNGHWCNERRYVQEKDIKYAFSEILQICPIKIRNNRRVKK